jgi:hypothetical protein
MVSYRSSDGKQSYHQTEELGEAINYVEHLRNDEAVDHARIYKLEEVSFEFRPYYRVELATSFPPPPAPVPAPPVDTEWLSPRPDETPPAPAPAPVDGDEVDPLAAAWSATDRHDDDRIDEDAVGVGMGRRGLFGR